MSIIGLIDVEGKEKKSNSAGKIYIIRNDVNNKVYIGQTEQSSVNKRFSQHKREAMFGNSTAKLYVAMREIGVEHFRVELLQDNIDILALDAMEIYYINKHNSFNSGYNTTIGGTIGYGEIIDGQIVVGDNGCKEETIEAINKAVIDAFFNDTL